MTYDPKVKELVESFYRDHPAIQQMTKADIERAINQTCETVQSTIENDLANLAPIHLRNGTMLALFGGQF